MSISGSLSNALSGLAVASRTAETVSANVSNATTEGYGRRVVSVTGSTVAGVGHGARVLSVERIVNRAAMTDRRLAEASLGFSHTTSSYFAGLEASIGNPTDAGSLGARLASFESALIASSSSPESDTRLREVADRAQDIVSTINAISDDIAAARQQADYDIALEVNRLNEAFQNVHLLNQQIMRQGVAGHDVSALMDERQAVIDQISDAVPIREIAGQDGRVTLITETGSTLVADQPAEIQFSTTPLVMPHMTQANGLLFGLRIVGSASSPGDPMRALQGGRLEALFHVRDEAAVASQAGLDGFVRDLMSRFEDPALDPSIAVGQPGLFTDRGFAFDPLSETGLAGRLSLNALVDPSSGGSLSQLRDGLYATPGPTGNAAILTAMSDALSDVRLPASGNFQVAGSISTLTASLLSQASQSRQSEEMRLAFAQAQTNALLEVEAQSAVDTDQEMQTLLMVEQLYAANAKVIETVDEMLQQILGL